MTTRAEYFFATSPSARWRTAKKAHSCWECAREIRVQDRYFDTGVVAIDRYLTAKLCLACAREDLTTE